MPAGGKQSTSVFYDVSLGLQLGDLAFETRDLELLRLHLAVARKRMFRIVGELLHPIAQLRHMHAQVLRSLHIGHASLLDQAHSLKLELAGNLPSLHDPPPAPSKHLTRCLRNRVQAIVPSQRSSIIVRWLRIVFYPILPRLPATAGPSEFFVLRHSAGT